MYNHDISIDHWCHYHKEPALVADLYPTHRSSFLNRHAAVSTTTVVSIHLGMSQHAITFPERAQILTKPSQTDSLRDAAPIVARDEMAMLGAYIFPAEG